MNRLKKALLIAVSVVVTVSLLFVLFIRIYLTDERLRNIAEPFLEEQLGREVSIGGFQIKVLRSLPNISIGATDVAIHSPTYKGTPAPDLASVSRLWVEVAVAPLLQNKIHVRALELDDPQILVEVYDDLSTNLVEIGQAEADSISQNAASDTETTEIALERVRIRNGQIGYVHADGTLLALDGVRADLSARLADVALLEGELFVEETYYETGGITYAEQWALGLDLLAEAHMDSAWLRVDRADLSVQDLVLELSGQVDDYDSEQIGVNLLFNAPEAAVSSFWSLLPASVVKNVEGLESEGLFSVKGSFVGELAEGSLPELNAEFKVSNGVIKYPDLPSSIRDLALDATLTNTQLTVREFRAQADGAQLQSNATITDFASPTLNADIDLALNLESLKTYYPLEDSTELAGLLTVDTQVRGPLERVDELNIAGVVELGAIDYASTLMEQPVRDLNGRLVINTDQIRFENISLISGQSDITFDGTMTGYEAFMADSLSPMPDPLLKGKIGSSYLNLTEQISEDTSSTFVGPLELPPIELDVQLAAEEMEFNGITFKDASGILSLAEGVIEFDDVSALLFGGGLTASGSFDLSDPYAPAFNGGVGLSELPATEFFSTFADMDAIVQLGNYLQGFFNSEATFGLNLDQDLNPQYESVVASGVFGAQQGSFGTMPLQSAIATYTGVTALESLNVNDWTHAFSVSGEKLHVQDLRFDAGEYALSLNGSQTFDGGMDYRLRVELPESASDALARAPVQGALSTLSNVVTTALKDPSNGRITLDLLATGTFMEPSVRLDGEAMTTRLTSSLTEGIKTEAEARIDSLQQSARERAEAELAEQRERLEERAEEHVEQLVEGVLDSSLVSTPLDSLKEKGADALQDRLKGLLNRKKRKN